MKTSSLFKLVANLATAFLLSLVLFGTLETTFLPEINSLKCAVIAVAITALVQLALVSIGAKTGKFAFFALQTEVWANDIAENLYMGNEFMKYATDHSMWVNHKTVHVPQSGSGPGVEKNRAIFPAPIGQRTDTELTYSLNQYTTDPILIQNLEELQISYSKRKSVLFNIMEGLRFVVATHTLYSWAPSGASRIVRTSGSTSTLNLPHSTATGSRKMITISDITKLKSILDKDNIPQSGRILLLPEFMYSNDLLNISGIITANSFGSPVLPSGVIARLAGFDIMIRSEVLVYDNTGTPVIKAIDGDGVLTAAAATDNGAAIAFHPSYVCHALGSIMPYYDENNPVYYGSILSAEVMHGAAKLRSDQKGVAALIQAA